MFTFADFSRGYYHIELGEAISFLTTFNTPFGRSTFTRMSFGLTVAGDVFQHKLDTIFNDLDFSTAIPDDMIIMGEETDGSDHNKHLLKVLPVHKTTQS